MLRLECRFCGRENWKSAGYRSTKHEGRKRIYKCLSCGRKFTPDSAFLGMKFPPETINKCIDLYNSGLSFRKICQHLNRTEGIKLSHTSIASWMRKYSRLLKPYIDSFKINGQDTHLHADEMMIQVGGKWHWLWNMLSREHRFLLAGRISKTRDMDDAKALFAETRNKMDGLPMQITTDGMLAYPRAINSVFYRNAYPRVNHNVAEGIGARRSNNLIERLHNTQKERVKIMRGFKEMGSASEIMDMHTIYYNYMRPHMTLGGKTPAESAGMEKRSLIGLIEEAYEWRRSIKGSG